MPFCHFCHLCHLLKPNPDALRAWDAPRSSCREDLASDANRETVRNFAISRGMHTDNGWHIWVIHPDALRAWDALNKAAVESPLIVLAGLK